jgi:large subunit ribosomal protein L9
MATPIQVVLQREVHNLGESGDVVRVRPGYARNFLYPRQLALPAKSARTTADQLGNVSVKITRAVGEENKMYGSVTAKDIEAAYAERGITIDRKQLDLKEPIRTLGLTEVPIKLYSDVTAVLRVEVVKQT